MSASLIGRLGSGVFQFTTSAVSRGLVLLSGIGASNYFHFELLRS